MTWASTCIVLAMWMQVAATPDQKKLMAPAGFGAATVGGVGGPTLLVTSLQDQAKHPAPGTLRWAIDQSGPRVIRFAVAGNIRLAAPLTIRNSHVTIDGSDAPGQGICLCDHSLSITDCSEVMVRSLRIRRGDISTLAENRASKRARPKSSVDLDCVSIDDSANVLFDHVSLSWCNDECFGIVRSRDVTVQWCILSEPLSNPALHPYGDDHAFGMNVSASRISVHHCLFAHYVMRGPQFEANDVRPGLGFNPTMEAVNNVLFDYQRSGSRYTTGIEDHPERAAGVQFLFQFVNNHYIGREDKPEIDAEDKHGVSDAVHVFAQGNVGPHRAADDAGGTLLFEGDHRLEKSSKSLRRQISKTSLFESPYPIPTQDALEASALVLQYAGCSHARDMVDVRIVSNVREGRFGRVLHSQSEVGGWPDLTNE